MVILVALYISEKKGVKQEFAKVYFIQAGKLITG